MRLIIACQLCVILIMKQLKLLPAALLLTLSWTTVSAEVDGDVIYGDDNRIDLYQVQNPVVRKLAESTAALFNANQVTLDAAGVRAALTTSHYGQEYHLCPDEPFYSQRTGAFCSGSLVGPDLMMTAGHCVKSQEACADVKFVFGFAVAQEGVLPESVPAGSVYGCGQLLGREQVGAGADWALVRLDRPVAGFKPLAVNKSGDIKKGTPLFVIGHPAGLPTKVAGGAAVRDPGHDGYFVANLDTYGGNSGSAVFNANTGLVEGILVRGEQDYEWRGSCRASKVCADDSCRGEDVTKISALSAQIPSPAALVENPAQDRILTPGPILSELLRLNENQDLP